MNPIENVLRISLEQIREMVNVNTVVGDPIITADGATVLPVSKVGMGFVAGGGEYMLPKGIKESGTQVDCQYPFGGTSAGGMNVSPVAFLFIKESEARLIPLQYECTLDRLVELIPDAVYALGGIIEGVCVKQKDEQTQNQ